MTIDPQRRQQILDKFPDITNERPRAPIGNTQVQACLRAEQILRRAWSNLAMADVLLTGVPAMRTRADAEAAEFHRLAAADARARAEGETPLLDYDTFDGESDYDPNATYEQGALKIWTVGTNHVDIVRERWHDSPNRRFTTAGYAAGMLAHRLDLAVYGDEPCNVIVSTECERETRLLPVDRGSLVLLFRVCWDCEAALTAALPSMRPGGRSGR